MMCMIVFLNPKIVIGQETGNRSMLSGEMYCSNMDFEFEVENNYFKDGDKIYVCPKNIPVTVTVVNTVNHVPVSAVFKWFRNGTPSSFTSNFITIQKTEFNTNDLNLTAEFNDPNTGALVTVSCKLKKKIEVNFSESAKKYQYDDNKIQKYIDSYGTEKLGTPWNFIENGKFEDLKAESSVKSGFYAINNIISNNQGLSISPKKLSVSPENINFSFSGTGKNIIEVHGCHETDPELLLFSAPAKSFEIDFFELCDTDDDIPLYCPTNRKLQADCLTPITSPDFVCIDGGIDLTIDEMWKENSSQVLLINAAGDRLVSDPSTKRYYVLAGTNLKCDHTANPQGPDLCPNSFNIATSVQVATDTYGKVAISVINNGVTPMKFNYDLWDDDGILDDIEYFELIKHRNSTNQLIGDNQEVYLVNELSLSPTGSVRTGMAIIGSNLVAINTKTAVSTTMTHEIGHAKWGFLHPIDPPLNVYDTKNFMYEKAAGRTMNIRRYHFTKMH